MKHFYLNVFFPLLLSARDLISAAFTPFYLKLKSTRKLLFQAEWITLYVDRTISKQKPNAFNVLKNLVQVVLAQVLTSVIGDLKMLNNRLFTAIESVLGAFGPSLNQQFFQSYSIKNSLTR